MTSKKGKMRSKQELKDRIEQWLNFPIYRLSNFSGNEVAELVIKELRFISSEGEYDVLKLMKEEMECRRGSK